MSFFDKIRDWFTDDVCDVPDKPFRYVTVEKGGNVSTIIGSSDPTRLAEMRQHNPWLDDQYHVQPGQVLKVPEEWFED